MYGILCVPSGIALFNSIFLINEARSDNVPPRIYFQGLWELVQKRVTWQLCLFLMVVNLFSNFNAGPAFQAASVFTVSFFCGAEISDIGNEGAVYGLLMTIQNIMPPFTNVFNSWLSSCFRADISTDNSHARSQVTTLFAISCSIRLLSLLALFLLPPQKRAVQNLKRYGGSNTLAAAIVIAAVFACFAFAILANLLSIFPSTSCLWIAGGSGCP
ncbi:unnamed protein product [Aphanomyces euteiches]